MKTPLLHLHLLPIYVSLAIAMSANSQQDPLLAADESTMVETKRVPGHNVVTFGPVPKDKQLFVTEWLEVAPTPVQSDRVVFAYLSGWIPETAFPNLESPELGLVNATLKVSRSGKFPDGSSFPKSEVTIPFKSTTIGNLHLAHFVIRDKSGKQVDYMPTRGGDVLLDWDFQIPRMYMKTGEWTFQVDVRLGDEDDTCLFALELTQWLDGDKVT